MHIQEVNSVLYEPEFLTGLIKHCADQPITASEVLEYLWVLIERDDKILRKQRKIIPEGEFWKALEARGFKLTEASQAKEYLLQKGNVKCFVSQRAPGLFAFYTRCETESMIIFRAYYREANDLSMFDIDALLGYYLNLTGAFEKIAIAAKIKYKQLKLQLEQEKSHVVSEWKNYH